MSNNKKFQRKYMHPTRRRLVDMVHNGEYNSPTVISTSISSNGATIRNVGDVWEDENGVMWEQKGFGKVKYRKNSSAFNNARKYISDTSNCKSVECDVIGKYSQSDKKLINLTGYCAGCLGRLETQIKLDSNWNAYLDYKSTMNKISYGNDLLMRLKQSLVEMDNIHTYINEDGSLDRWISSIDVDKVRIEIQKDIDKMQSELQNLIEVKDNLYTLLKDKNYDLV